LAYGPNGPASIGPNQTLIFTVELLDITTPWNHWVAVRPEDVDVK
jgi:hypothetical protein